MTILVLSDTHGNIQPIQKLLEDYKDKADAVIHLGDYAKDMVRFAKGNGNIHIVNGNNEIPVAAYEDRVIEIGGKRIFICHGHRYQVKSGLDKLIYHARELNVDACLFGHTHVPECFTEHGIVFLNPGSITYPFPQTKGGYGLLRASEDGTVSGRLFPYKESIW